MNLKDGGVKILAVSNESDLLSQLECALKKIFPNAVVVKETDPLMACKFSFNNAVNYAFASEEMRRMSGSDLLRFIKKEHPNVKTYLIREGAENPSFFDDSDGVIGCPFSVEELTKTLDSGVKTANLRG